MGREYSEKTEDKQVISAASVPTFGNFSMPAWLYSREVPKDRKQQPDVVRIVGANVRALLDYADLHPDLRDRSTPPRLVEYIAERQPQWGDRVGKSTIYRIINEEGPVGIDVVALIARAFDVQPWHLLLPGLEPSNPPYALATEQERALWNDLRAVTRKHAGALDKEDEKATQPENARRNHHSESNAQSPTDPAHNGTDQHDP